MLPSRPTLQGWHPDDLAGAADRLATGARSVSDAVTDIDTELHKMPEVRAWEGPAEKAAEAMFGRAGKDASRFGEYAVDIASALGRGSEAIGSARSALLNHANEVDRGPLEVSDSWVVLIDPVRASAEEMAALQQQAEDEQSTINAMLLAVGDADDDTAAAVIAAGKQFGFVEPTPPTDFSGLMLATAQRPADQVPDPRTPMGTIQQQAIRNGDMSVTIREVTDGENAYGEEERTVVMQDGSKHVLTRADPFEWYDRTDFYTVTQYDKDGHEVSRTSSWHDLGNDCDYTAVQWPDGSNFTMSMDPTGYRTAAFTTADGRHQVLPVELIDNISLGSSSVMSGLEKHIARGGSLPMVTTETVEKVGKAMKFGGPALGIATTVFDMAMADNFHDRCIAAIAGASGVGGGWGGAELGALAGAATGPFAPVGVPALAFVGAIGGGAGSAALGKIVGDIVCPY